MKITNIEKLRRASNLTQTQLAEQIGVTCMAVSNWERNKTTPSAMATLKMAQIFGCDPQDILGGEELCGLGRGADGYGEKKRKPA